MPSLVQPMKALGMTDLIFSDSRLHAIQRRAYQNFNDQPALRDWLLSRLTIGAYLRYGPWGWHENHFLLPVRVGDHCADLVYWPMDTEPAAGPTNGSEKPETFYPDECFQTVDGAADVFGVEAMSRAIIYNAPLKVFRSPWQLLLAASKNEFIYLNDSPGAVLLNRDFSSWAALSHLSEIHAQNRAHAIELRRFIRAAGKKPPPIKFPESDESQRAA